MYTTRFLKGYAMCMGIRKTLFSKSEATPLYKIRPGIANLTFT